MAGLTGRMSTVVKAKVSKLLDRAEDPAETLDYSYQKQVEQLQNVKKGIADVVTAKKRLQMQESTLQQQVVKLDTQARQALSLPARKTSRAPRWSARTSPRPSCSRSTPRSHELEDQQQKLTDSEQKLRAKIEAFRTKKEVIKAQYSAAEAQVRISEAATGVGEQMADVGLAMQRAVDKTENMKARADAVGELEAAGTFEDLTQLGSGEDDIDRQLKQLSSNSAVDDDLAKMKGELGMPAPTGAAEPAGELAAPGATPGGTAQDASRRRPRAARDDRPHLRRGPVPPRRRRRRASTSSTMPCSRRSSRAAKRAASAPPTTTLLDVRPRQRHAGRRRRARELRPDPAAARPQLRRGRPRVHRRGPDPRLSPVTTRNRGTVAGACQIGIPQSGNQRSSSGSIGSSSPICAFSCSSRSVERSLAWLPPPLPGRARTGTSSRACSCR